MHDEKQGKTIPIKANDGFASLSQHTLDLKYKKEKKSQRLRPILIVAEKKKVLKDLFLVSLILAAIFLPKKLFTSLSRATANIFKNIKNFFSAKRHRLSERRPMYFDFAPPEHW